MVNRLHVILSFYFLQHIPYAVVDIKTIGDRIVCSDIQESVHFLKYRPLENQLVIFADDTAPRWVTATCVLDYNTVAIADKFGSVAICRYGLGIGKSPNLLIQLKCLLNHEYMNH